MTHSTPEPVVPPLLALGDQVQAVLQNSPYPIAGFVILSTDGPVEYRSPYPLPVFKAQLQRAVDGL